MRKESVMLQFTVYGKQATAGSKRGFPFTKKNGGLGVRVTHDNANTRSWMQQVAGEAFNAMRSDAMMLGPVLLRIVFTFPRPAWHFGTGRNANTLKATAPEHHTQKPDCTKLTRAIEDALTGTVWRDDSQVARLDVRKCWGERYETSVTVIDI